MLIHCPELTFEKLHILIGCLFIYKPRIRLHCIRVAEVVWDRPNVGLERIDLGSEVLGVSPRYVTLNGLPLTFRLSLL